MFQVVGSIQVCDDMVKGKVNGVFEFSDNLDGSIFIISDERGTHRVSYSSIMQQPENSMQLDKRGSLIMNFNEIEILINNRKLVSRVEVFIPNAQILCDFMKRLGFRILEKGNEV